MPVTQHNSNGINAKRFAALLAGFDTGNACEEEALSKGRALRRMASEKNLRIVDVLEMADVRKAIDDQMQPVREDRRELESAMEQTAMLREELTQRTRDVRRLAEMLTQARRATEALRKELATRSPASSRATTHSFGAQSWVFEVVAVGMALLLMAVSVFH